MVRRVQETVLDSIRSRNFSLFPLSNTESFLRCLLLPDCVFFPAFLHALFFFFHASSVTFMTSAQMVSFYCINFVCGIWTFLAACTLFFLSSFFKQWRSVGITTVSLTTSMSVVPIPSFVESEMIGALKRRKSKDETQYGTQKKDSTSGGNETFYSSQFASLKEK